MSCTRGCCATPAEHYRSLSVAASDRTALSKTTTDDHGTHKVDVTERWSGQDVTVKVPRVTVKTTTNEEF